MSDKNLRITEDHAGRRLDNFLFNVYKSLPKSKIYNMIRKGEIRVNSGRIKPSRKLHLNDEIRIPPYLVGFDENEVSIKIPPSRVKEYWKSILFENNDYVVFNKDPELSVHSGSNNQFGLIDIARAAHTSDDIDLCHRIDKSTSGCIVLAKNKKFLRNFHAQLKNNKITKKYEAILIGLLKGNQRIETKIDSSTKEFLHKVQEASEGKAAISEFKLIKNLGYHSYVEVLIFTGRMHQIRVQSANINLPIVNDKKYGDFAANKQLSKETGVSRLALHSSFIEFHDQDGLKVSYKAPIDKDFDILLTKLSKVTIKS
jgi:23S rRNA pseudouridine955/2504/2580 synthase